MKSAVVLTPAASSRTRPTASTPRERSDNFYFHGCRKDTNCHCEICLASIDATRDLIPSGSSVQQCSLTKSSASRPVMVEKKVVPIPFDPESPPAFPEVGSTLASPQSGSSLTPPMTPATKSTAKHQPVKKIVIKKKRCWIHGNWVLRVIVGLISLWAVDLGFSVVMSSDVSIKLTAKAVEQVGEECRIHGNDLKQKFDLLQQKIERLVEGRVSTCNSTDSLWELNQGGQFLIHWRCFMYKSVAEKVSVWGSPLRTTGLLATGFSSRSMKLLSGKIVEWSDGKLLDTKRTSKCSSWIYGEWSSAVVQLDPNTWVLEYERSALFQGPGVIPATWEVLKMRVSKKLKTLKQHAFRRFMVNTFFGAHYNNHRRKKFNTTNPERC